MKTKRVLLLLCVVVMSLSASGASAAMRGSPMMGRPSMGRAAMMRPTPHFAPRNMMTGRHRFFNDRFDRFDRFIRFDHFHRFNNDTFVFVDTFGFPFFFPYPFYPYPYYGYYPYGSYGYGGAYRNGTYAYGTSSSVVEVRRRLARAGYYHGRIDGIMGSQTRRAIRAYERDHNTRAYGLIDQRRLTVALG